MNKKLLTTFTSISLLCSNITTCTGPTYLSVDNAQPRPLIKTKDPADLFKQANNLFRENKLDEAIALYTEAIELRPDFYQAYFNRGLLFVQQKKLEQAEHDLKTAHEIAPHYDRAWLQLADVLKKRNKIEEAIAEYEKLIAAKPNHFDAHLHLARICSECRQFDKALALFERALELRPGNRQCTLDYANNLNLVHRTQEALEQYKKIETDNHTNVLHNIAYTLKKLNRMEEALTYYEKVIAVKPDHAEAHFGLGCTLIMLENFIDGFAEYEWRWNRKTQPFPPPVGIKKWNGVDNLQGKTILLQAEQGLGDTFQFIRYAQLIKARGAYVVFASQKPLMKLLSNLDYIDEVVSIHLLPPPPCDYYVSLMSLPHILGTEVETIPNKIPYLKADPNLVAHWQKELADDTNFKIGICWQGNPNYSTPFLRSAVANKSVQLKQFETIANIPGVSLYCLQKMSGEEQLKNLPEGFNLHVFGPDFDNKHGRFMDTAAVMKNLDLVLTVDTSIAHLAGGLNVPVWVLLPEPADWRWMLRETNSPWYPHMRLFRQPAPNDWDSVFQFVAQQLVEKLGQENTIKNPPNDQRLVNDVYSHDCRQLEDNPWSL